MKRIIRTLLLALGLFVFAAPATVYADDVLQGPCRDVPDAVACQGRSGETPDSNSLYGPNGILTKATSIIALLVGIAAVIVIIIGGLQYVLSSGDSTRVSSAKNTILYAVIGLVIALLAQGIVIFVLNKL